jgi:colicin import membrane protein
VTANLLAQSAARWRGGEPRCSHTKKFAPSGSKIFSAFPVQIFIAIATAAGSMPRKLKVYQTSQGFYDLAIAAPSMAAALRAWGANPDLFQQGFARQSEDEQVIAAAMAQPGVVLRRPVGSSKRFQEHAELPTVASLTEHLQRSKVPRERTNPPKPKEADEKTERKAASAFEKEERRRELERRKSEAAAAKVHARRNVAIEQARSTLEEAGREHAKRVFRLEKEREAVDRRAENEETLA